MRHARPLALAVAVVAAACGTAPTAGTIDATASDAGAPVDLDATAGEPDATASDAAAPVVIDPTGIPPAAALYTTDRVRHDVRAIGEVLDAALAPSVTSVILYVHGRGCGGGGEPQKSLDGALPDLERDYGGRAVMLFWPGSDDACPLGFPEARARAAGPALAVVMGDLAAYAASHPARVAGVRFTLITHSMGSLVLERAVTVGGVAQLPPVFDTVIVNSAASAAPGHAAWVGAVGVGRARYVTVNGGDDVLAAAGVGRATRLGRSIDGVGLAAGVDYVDFTASGVDHAYYLIGGQHGAGMTAFYRAVMTGRAYDLAHAPGIASHTQRDGARVHVFDGT